MKKIISLCLLFATLITMTACDGLLDRLMGEEEEKTDSVITVANVELVENYSTHPVDELDYSSFRDDDYYYYVFYLGCVERVPLQELYPSYHYTGNEYKKTLTAVKTTSTAVENAYEKVTTISDSWQNTWQNEVQISSKVSVEAGFDFFGAKGGVKAELSTSLKTGLELSWSGSSVESVGEKSSKIESFSEQIVDTVEFQFDSTCKHGYYRYILMGSFDVYAIVVYDPADATYYIGTYSNLYNQSYTLDYSENSRFSSNSLSDLQPMDGMFDGFDFSAKPDKYIPSDQVIDPVDPDKEPELPKYLEVSIPRKNCNNDNNYNAAEQEESEDWRADHDHFEMGKVLLYGCTQGTRYTVVSGQKLSIQYRLDQNTQKLPQKNNHDMKMLEDSCDRVVGTSIDSRVGMGAWWIRVTYDDGTPQQEFKGTDMFKGRLQGDYITLLSDTDLRGDAESISKIELVIVYELWLGDGSFLGMSDHYTNWRYDYTFNFS